MCETLSFEARNGDPKFKFYSIMSMVIQGDAHFGLQLEKSESIAFFVFGRRISLTKSYFYMHL